MKLPRTPKPLTELLVDHRDRLDKVLGQRLGPTVDGRYPHWDKLRHLAVPTGVQSPEEWWLALKLARTGLYRELPLRDTDGRPFVYLLPDGVHEALHRIDSQSHGWIGAAAAGVANTDTRNQFIVNSLIQEAIASSQLEGASTTRAVAAEMIRAGRRPRDRSEQMILNNYLAMDAIRQLRDQPLTDEAVMELHAMITADTLDDPDGAGRMQRPADRRVMVWDNRDQTVLHSPPRAEDLPDRMREMVRFANHGLGDGSFLHPVIHAIILHFWLAYDHPFADGNGRTARALFYWAMLRHQYRMFEFASISSVLNSAPGQYARSFLHTETDDNDLTYFIEHQLGVMLRAIADVESYITRKTEQVRQVEETLRRSTDLNHRQLALLAHAIRHPNAEYTIRSHMTSHVVAYATARADLFRLADLGLLERRRVGRRSYLFRAPSDLVERVKIERVASTSGGVGSHQTR